MTDNVTTLPTPGVILDLDALVRDPKDIKDPFIIKVGERQVTFKDPMDIDWRDLAAVQIPADMIRVSLSKEDRNFLSDLELPTWKFSELMEKYYKYYDLEDRIRDAKRREALG